MFQHCTAFAWLLWGQLQKYRRYQRIQVTCAFWFQQRENSLFWKNTVAARTNMLKHLPGKPGSINGTVNTVEFDSPVLWQIRISTVCFPFCTRAEMRVKIVWHTVAPMIPIPIYSASSVGKLGTKPLATSCNRGVWRELSQQGTKPRWWTNAMINASILRGMPSRWKV